MAVVNASLCLPFQQTQEVIDLWEQSVREACKHTCFPFEEEVADVLREINDLLPPLLYAHLIESITLDFGLTEVQYLLRYDATPEDVDELDLEILDLVLEPPGTCVITFFLTDPEKAAFLNGLDLERSKTAHVSVVTAAATAAQKETDDVSAREE